MQMKLFLSLVKISTVSQIMATLKPFPDGRLRNLLDWIQDLTSLYLLIAKGLVI